MKNLVQNLAVYGLGDAATSIASLLLLPIYTRYLTPEDYGVITMLLMIEAVAKVTFRWGVDTAFMRLFYDCPDQSARQRLASTLFFFLLVVNGAMVCVAVASAGWLSTLLFGTASRAWLIRLVLANTFVAGFYFMPFHVLRIGERSGSFVALGFGRSAGTLVMRLVLVIAARMGVLGVVLADVLVTAVFTPIVSVWLLPLIRPVFSRAVLREALGFGLPRIPHSIANQIIALADRTFLNAYAKLGDVGVYSVGASFGMAPKLFLTAFESAWTPFFLGVMHEEDAKTTYSTVSTYVMLVLVLLVAGLAGCAPDLLRLTTTRQFHGASSVTPWIALGAMFQGVYLVGSIGIIITKRTAIYPVATGIAAAVSLAANALLIPMYGSVGAAWANAIAYGVLALVTVAFSLHYYPISYEWGRLLRIAAAGLAGAVLARWLVPVSVPAIAGLLLRGVVSVAAYGSVLLLTGFFHSGELRMLSAVRARLLDRRRGPIPPPNPSQVEMAGEIVAAPEPLEALDAQPRQETPDGGSTRFDRRP
jgi:O-antigen/teichoic acid export membrane protein